MLPTGAEFFEAFFGALYAGAIPVPVYPPFGLSRIEEHLLRQAAILNNSQATALITFPEASMVAKLLKSRVRSLRIVRTVSELRGQQARDLPSIVDTEQIALLQYTSGSTGDPSGVVLRHRNILANIRAMAEAIQVTSSDVIVSWLPLYHDMGLIGTWLGSLYVDARSSSCRRSRFWRARQTGCGRFTGAGARSARRRTLPSNCAWRRFRTTSWKISI